MNMMKHSIENQIISTKAIDFSPLKSRALVDFTTLKSRTPVGFQSLPTLASRRAHALGLLRAGELEAGSCNVKLTLRKLHVHLT